MRVRRVPALLIGLLALVVAPVAVVPAAQAADTGTLSVRVVDWNGDPMPGQISVIGVDDQGLGTHQTTQTASYDVALEPGSYGVLSLSGWGGFLCAGVAPCDYYAVVSGVQKPDGTVQVVSGQTTNVTIRADYPVVLQGKGQIGKPLVLDYSEGMDTLQDYLGTYGGGAYHPTVTWLANGAPINGQSGDSLTPTGAQAGAAISATLEYTGMGKTAFEQIAGGALPPVATDSVTVKKIPTKTFALLFVSSIPSDRQARVRIEVTAKEQIVTGKVKVTAAGVSKTAALHNGTARVLLPKLKPGKYPVQATYLGSKAFKASTAKSKVLTITK